MNLHLEDKTLIDVPVKALLNIFFDAGLFETFEKRDEVFKACNIFKTRQRRE